MNTTVRRIAVSTTATAMLLGGAAVTAEAATPEHTTTVATIARGDTSPTDDATNPNPNEVTSNQLQTPASPGQVPATYNVQPAAASGGALAGGVVAILVLGIIVFVRVKGKDVKVGDAVVLTLFGIAVAGTVVGTLGTQLTNSAIGSVGGVLGGL